MSDLVWKREKEKLAKKRSIICEVPELLMEILEHDFTASGGWTNDPEDPIEVRYYWGRGDRGVAWTHLMQNKPIIEVVEDGETKRFKPVFETQRHPYRKCHGADYWGWAVYKWELIVPKEKEDAADAKAN